ncbi:Phosphoglucosamine mutase [subsurface metagenome]
MTEREKNIIDPIVAPTSGLRIQICDIIEENKKYYLPNSKLFLFLRVFKAISQHYIELRGNQNLKVLIVSDNRLSKSLLLQYCSEIFAYDGFQIYHQQDSPNESKVSAPYGAASVALYEDINLIIVLTASHNDLSWNGIKFYIEYPMPMSGRMFKDISRRALNYKEIYLKTDYNAIQIDTIKKNNDYVKKLLSGVLEITSIKGKNIVIWPYLGKARGIVNLFKDYGANVILIEEEINPPNPIKIIHEKKLKDAMEQNNSTIALLLDADRDRIVLYVKQNGEYFTYIPNEIYSALHNILTKEFGKKIINVRTIPSDLRGDQTSFLNILTGVGYKHLGVIMYFLFGIEVEQSKVDTAILYLEDQNKELIKINNPVPLKQQILELMELENIDIESFLMVYWEESGGHTLNILNVYKNPETGEAEFSTDLPIIADKYPVPALVLITELICRGFVISESIDWSIKGINRTIPAIDEEKVKIMKNFNAFDGKTIVIGEKDYQIHALSDNNNNIDIYQLKSKDSTLYFRPSGTGPDVRFYIFGKRETHLEEIHKVMEYIKNNFK